MGMYGKLRHVPAGELRAAKENPARFYRGLFGSRGGVPDKREMTRIIGAEMGKAVASSEYLDVFRAMPEMKRIQEALRAGRPIDASDQEAVGRKMFEILPKIDFRPNLPRFAAVSRKSVSKIKIPEGLELDKSWHSLHFMLTGKSWESGEGALGTILLGGNELPDTEHVMGYGPVRYAEAEEVKESSVALGAFPIRERAAGFDPAIAGQQKVYCPNFGPDALEHYFGLLRDY